MNIYLEAENFQVSAKFLSTATQFEIKPHSFHQGIIMLVMEIYYKLRVSIPQMSEEFLKGTHIFIKAHTFNITYKRLLSRLGSGIKLNQPAAVITLNLE